MGSAKTYDINDAEVLNVLCDFKQQLIHFHTLWVEVVPEANALRTGDTPLRSA